ncbi:MAG: ATP-dependent helicase [Spirochaetales bacterium]|nr:ATP-dependent helicase [Spirochaetales bacterium]
MQNIQNHLQGLNEQQLEAVLCDADIVYVEAGPGTGKTHMLTSKLVVYARTEGQKIVALSYTNTAARQLGERFNKVAPEGDYTFFNGTIHSFCFRMLKAYKRETYDYVILDEEELHELAEDIYEAHSKSVPLQQILSCLRSDKRDVPEELFNEVSGIKEAYKVISMQDILANFAKTLDEDEGFRNWIGGQVTVIAIDEAQDLTELYYSIIDRLIKIIPGLKVFLVGDPRQNIFEFNGGSYRNLEDFLIRNASHATKRLTITYRCPQSIADYVNGFRFSDCDNSQLQSRCSSAGQLSIKRAFSESHEADLVLHEVLDCDSLNSCAVLCNNLRYMETLIDRLCELELPYRVFGGRKLIKRHVRFLNHVLRIIDSDNAYSIRKVAQYAGIDLMDNGKRKKSRFYASELGKLITEIGKEQPFNVIMEQVIERIMRDPSDDDSVKADYDLLMTVSLQYETTTDYLLAFATDRDRFAPFFNSDYRECPVDNEGEFLTISTIHSAKGLEWDNVFIMGLCEGNFPNDYFCAGLSQEEKMAFFNGEWKKMYVASTRARKTLTLTYPTTIFRKGYTFKKEPSRFIVNYGNTTQRIPANHRGLPGRYGSERPAVR